MSATETWTPLHSPNGWPASLKRAVGISVDEFRAGGYDSNPTGSYYPMMAAQVLETIGYRVEEYTTNIEPVVTRAPREFRFFDEPIPAGHCPCLADGAAKTYCIAVKDYCKGQEETTWIFN